MLCEHDFCTKHVTQEPASIECGVFRTLQEMQNRGWSRHSLSSAPKQSGNTRATPNIVDKAIADSAVHTRMTWKFLFDVFGGSGFVAITTIIWFLRGYVLDTKFGTKYDVTQPLVLAGIRQDVSAGECVAGMISPPRQHTSCSSKVIISASASIANLLQRARIP